MKTVLSFWCYKSRHAAVCQQEIYLIYILAISWSWDMTKRVETRSFERSKTVEDKRNQWEVYVYKAGPFCLYVLPLLSLLSWKKESDKKEQGGQVCPKIEPPLPSSAISGAPSHLTGHPISSPKPSFSSCPPVPTPPLSQAPLIYPDILSLCCSSLSLHSLMWVSFLSLGMDSRR